MLWLTLVTAVAVMLVAAASAAAHVTVRPAFAVVGETITLSFEAPNERGDHPMTEIEIAAPRGIRLLAAERAAGWQASVDGDVARWRAGSLKPGSTVVFALRAEVTRSPGTVGFRATQRFDDGALARWDAPLSVLPPSSPAPRQHLDRALVAGAIGLAVLVGSLLLLRRLRRRALQER